MGRKRTKTPAWLPQRCYPHRRQIIYYPANGKPIPLGAVDDPSGCLKKYAELFSSTMERPRTLHDVFVRYQIEVLPGKAPRTQEDYRAYIAKLDFAFGQMLPDDVSIAHLYDYHNARKAPVRANREVTVLGMIYRHAIRWRAATTNPVQGFLYAEERGRDREVTGRERRLFARHHCPPWLRGYLLLKYLTGRRQGEMLKLSTFSEKPDGIAFQILKKRKTRTLVVTWTPRLRKVWAWVKAQSRPENCAWIFWSHRGKTRGDRLSARGFKSAWVRAQASWTQAGNEAFWEHDIRGMSGSDAVSDTAAQELLDHATVQTTRRSYRRGKVVKVPALK